MNAIKSLFAASIFIAASTANATVWNITATGSEVINFVTADTNYSGTWNDVSGEGNITGTFTAQEFIITANTTQKFSMSVNTGEGILQSASGTTGTCSDNVSGGLCTGVNKIYFGSMYNNISSSSELMNPLNSFGTPFIPSNGVYAWTLLMETGLALGEDVPIYTPYLLNVTLSSMEAPAVPVPAAAWLFGSGLLGLASRVRRGKKA
jgi:hypothetical protein